MVLIEDQNGHEAAVTTKNDAELDFNEKYDSLPAPNHPSELAAGISSAATAIRFETTPKGVLIFRIPRFGHANTAEAPKRDILLRCPATIFQRYSANKTALAATSRCR